uniref:NSF attachment protein alpha n=1 Tax=Capra hircus TaxID=9925 RepID=A0A8C2RMH3_CAPHI
MDNSGKEAEAMALLAEAERKVKNSQSFFSGLFGGSSKIEEACEIYARAANMFKMAKNWSAAGSAFCQAAQLHLQLQSKHDAATCFVDAGNAFKKADPQEAINCLMRAIEIYTDMGRFTIAAKHHISIAEIYETELVDIEKVGGRGPSLASGGEGCCCQSSGTSLGAWGVAGPPPPSPGRVPLGAHGQLASALGPHAHPRHAPVLGLSDQTQTFPGLVSGFLALKVLGSQGVTGHGPSSQLSPKCLAVIQPSGCPPPCACRWGPTPWTAHSSSIAPRTTFSRLLSATSALTC